MAKSPGCIRIDSDTLRRLAEIGRKRASEIEIALMFVEKLVNVSQVFGSVIQQRILSNKFKELKKRLDDANDIADRLVQILNGFASDFDSMASNYSQRASNITQKMSNSIPVPSSDGSNLIATYVPQDRSAPQISEIAAIRDTSKELKKKNGFFSWLKDILSWLHGVAKQKAKGDLDRLLN